MSWRQMTIKPSRTTWWLHTRMVPQLSHYTSQGSHNRNSTCEDNWGVLEAGPGLHISWYNQGHVSIKRPSFPGMEIPMLKIRRSWDRLIFNMGIPILAWRYLYIEMAPRKAVFLYSKQPPVILYANNFLVILNENNDWRIVTIWNINSFCRIIFNSSHLLLLSLTRLGWFQEITRRCLYNP